MFIWIILEMEAQLFLDKRFLYYTVQSVWVLVTLGNHHVSCVHFTLFQVMHILCQSQYR